MSSSQVAVFMDYENIRVGIWKHFQRRIPEDISIENLLSAVRQIAEEIGNLYEGYIFGDWTIRGEDAKQIDRVPQFRAQLVLRSDSKKDRTDPVMNFAIGDFYREKSDINNILLCAGDSDYCEVLRRGNRLSKQVYVSAISPQTAPELLSLAQAFYPFEHRLGLKSIDMEDLALAIADIDPAELNKWTPLIAQLSRAEQRLPDVVRSHFIKQFISPGLGYGDTFEQKEMTLNLAEEIGFVVYDRVPHPEDGRPVRTVQLNRDNPMVKAVLARPK